MSFTLFQSILKIIRNDSLNDCLSISRFRTTLPIFILSHVYICIINIPTFYIIFYKYIFTVVCEFRQINSSRYLLEFIYYVPLYLYSVLHVTKRATSPATSIPFWSEKLIYIHFHACRSITEKCVQCVYGKY